MTETIRWYLVPRVDYLGQRIPDPAMSQVALSRCVAFTLDDDWALARIATTASGHVTLAASALVPLPRLLKSWGDAPAAIKTRVSRLAPSVRETDSTSQALDKLLAYVNPKIRRSELRLRCVRANGLVIDETDMVED